jgi:threonine/homoserine/homoserine lactone efflux protein
VTCSFFVAMDVAIIGSGRRRYPWVQVVLEVALAVALIWLAGRVRRRPPNQGEVASGRAHRLSERLGRLGLLTTLGAGLVLGIGVPKRLVLAAFAATAIRTAGLRSPGEAALVVVYVAVSTALVWGPVILFVLVGERTVALMKRAEGEVRSRQPQVTVYALLILAAIFAIDAGSILVTQVR